jgi:hypothetical protein
VVRYSSATSILIQGRTSPPTVGKCSGVSERTLPEKVKAHSLTAHYTSQLDTAVAPATPPPLGVRHGLTARISFKASPCDSNIVLANASHFDALFAFSDFKPLYLYSNRIIDGVVSSNLFGVN